MRRRDLILLIYCFSFSRVSLSFNRCLPRLVMMYTPLAGVSTSPSSARTARIFRTCCALTLSSSEISVGVILGFCSITFSMSIAVMGSHVIRRER